MIKPGIKIDDSELRKVLGRTIERGQNKQQALRTIGAIGRESVRSNFRSGGRPKRWPASKRASRKVRGKRGRTLRRTGRLMNSISYSQQGEKVIIGSNLIYAGTMHHGAKKAAFGTVVARIPAHRRKISSRNRKSGRKKTASGVAFVKAHTRKIEVPWGDIPARPFMVLQTEDIRRMEKVMADHIVPQ